MKWTLQTVTPETTTILNPLSPKTRLLAPRFEVRLLAVAGLLCKIAFQILGSSELSSRMDRHAFWRDIGISGLLPGLCQASARVDEVPPGPLGGYEK